MRISTVLVSIPVAFVLLSAVHAQELRSGSEAFGGWEDDAPGVRRHITAQDLPPPSHDDNDPEEPDFEHPPEVVEPPPGMTPDLPEGFSAEVFASGMDEPRIIRLAPNGDIFVAESGSGRILVFAADSLDKAPAEPDAFAEGLEQPYGIVFYPVENPEYVYVGTASEVVRFPYSEGDRAAGGAAEVIVADIPTERHWTRDLEVSADGESIFVSIGSASNVAAEMPEKTEQEIATLEQEQGVGAAWGAEENRAVVRVFNPDGSELRNYATGLRNCSGMTLQAETGSLWCTGNERDHLGADLVPDYLSTIEDGKFYGWPWYYMGDNEDPAHAGERPDLQGKVGVPEVLLQAHSSTMDLVFYDGDAFPEEYHGDIFATMRGSWNREKRTGYKVIRALMENGEPTGVYEDFMTGLVIDEETVWARPVGIAVAQDGSLLVSDDANGTIFRITHESGQ